MGNKRGALIGAGLVVILGAAYSQPLSIDGHIVNTYGWDDSQMAITQARTPAANYPGLGAFPAGAASKAYLFDAASDECIEGSLQLSHSYKLGTTLKCHIHWAPTSTNAGTVAWQLNYTLAGIGAVFAAGGPLYISQAGGGVANAHQVADFADIACPTCGISSIMDAVICRDANDTGGGGDTYDADAAGLYFDCHYQIDSLGSTTDGLK